MLCLFVVIGWLSGAASIDVKNTRPLGDARKSIESLMERFKVLEKETKTKAYSKEGLDAASNRRYHSGQLGDTADEVTLAVEWVDECINELELQRDKLQDGVDRARVGASKKKAMSEEAHARHWHERHQYHIDRLEAIRDALHDNTLQASDIDDIKDAVDDYVQNSQSSEFEESELLALYDSLDIDSFLSLDSDDNDDLVDESSKSESDTDNTASNSTAQAIKPLNNTSKSQQINSSKSTNSATTQPKHQLKSSPPTTSTVPFNIRTPVQSSKPTTTSSISSIASTLSSPANRRPSSVPSVVTPNKPSESLASILAKSKPTTHNINNNTTILPISSPLSSTISAPPSSSTSTAVTRQSSTPLKPTSTATPLSIITNSNTSTSIRIQPSPTSAAAAIPLQSNRLTNDNPASSQQSMLSQPLNSTRPNSTYNDSTLSQLTDYQSTQLKQLQQAAQYLPESIDTERAKVYIPRNPYRTPSYFPSVPAQVFEQHNNNISNTSSIWDKFSADTLFFIFYFQQGTSHQYLAARELKRQSWRYHKNFLTWFQRHVCTINKQDITVLYCTVLSRTNETLTFSLHVCLYVQ